MVTIRSTTILFENDVLELINKQAHIDGQSTTEYMRNAVLEKLEDSLDYQDAVKNIRTSDINTISRKKVKKQLGL